MRDLVASLQQLNSPLPYVTHRRHYKRKRMHLFADTKRKIFKAEIGTVIVHESLKNTFNNSMLSYIHALWNIYPAE